MREAVAANCDMLETTGAALETPELDALLLAYVRQAEALGISVVNLLNETLLAEHDVIRFERRTGRPLEVESFMRSRASLARLTAEEWKTLDVLTEIIRNVPRALECWRVRYALRWLRSARLLYAEKDLPLELKKRLRRIGSAIDKPTKWTRWKESEREQDILAVYALRHRLGEEARELAAKRLGLRSSENTPAWKTLERMALRFKARAKGPKPPGGVTALVRPFDGVRTRT